VQFTAASSQYVNYGDTAQIDPTTAFTVAWIGTNDDTAAAFRTIGGKWRAQTTCTAGVGCQQVRVVTTGGGGATSTFRVDISTTGTDIVSATSAAYALPYTTPKVVIATYDNATLRLYVDGVETTASQTGPLNTTGTAEWVLGANKNTSDVFTNFWNGTMGDLWYFDRVLTAAERTVLTNRMWERITVQQAVRESPSLAVIDSKLYLTYITGKDEPYLEVLSSGLSPTSAADFTKSGSLTVNPNVRLRDFVTMRGASKRHALLVTDLARSGGPDESGTYNLNTNIRQWSVGGAFVPIYEGVQ
jgi:hypothetical protein